MESALLSDELADQGFLLTSAEDRPLSDLMVTQLVTVRAEATVLIACEQFILHRFLALPVVDREGGIWWPSEEASYEIEASSDPSTTAIRLCVEEPYRGEWRA